MMCCSRQKEIGTYKKNYRYTQNPKITERRIDDTVFLVDSDMDIVFYLDSLGSGIWQLLKEPLSLMDVTQIVQQAFPEVPPEKIAGDVARLIDAMSQRNLVLSDA